MAKKTSYFLDELTDEENTLWNKFYQDDKRRRNQDGKTTHYRLLQKASCTNG